MASGIGPAQHLTDHSIDVVHDNPHVGENLQDHPAVVVSYDTPQRGVSVTSKLRVFGFTNPLAILKWLVFKRGILTSVGCDHGAFVTTCVSHSQPDLQIRFVPARAIAPDGTSTYSQFRLTRHVTDGYTFQNVAIRAKSKGYVRLASSNTHVKPIIEAGYLSNQSDIDTLRQGIKLSRMLGRRQEWAEYLGEEVFPGRHVQTDDQINEYIRHTVHSSNALIGTCRMGTGRDAVVGPDLRVIGVKNVRVCDSSVMGIVGGSTATPTVMIADRAAAMILNPDYVAAIDYFPTLSDDTVPSVEPLAHQHQRIPRAAAAG
jgi:choline dehydrogenase-like flavoprotein